jgi:hypothetical protein
MDIEGWELGVLQTLIDLPRTSPVHPLQISLETHGGDEATWVFRALFSLGYAPVYREQNKLGCATGGWEWTWVRAFCDLSPYGPLHDFRPAATRSPANFTGYVNL